MASMGAVGHNDAPRTGGNLMGAATQDARSARCDRALSVENKDLHYIRGAYPRKKSSPYHLMTGIPLRSLYSVSFLIPHGRILCHELLLIISYTNKMRRKICFWVGCHLPV